MNLKKKKEQRDRVKMTKSQLKERRWETSQQLKKGEKKQLIHPSINKEVKIKNEIELKKVLEVTSKWQFLLQMLRLL